MYIYIQQNILEKKYLCEQINLKVDRCNVGGINPIYRCILKYRSRDTEIEI